jgi:hypothetical protein
MIYLTGTAHRRLYDVPDIGMMLSPASTKPVPAGMPWAADNGCFGDRYVGDDAFLAWLDGRDRAGCLFAVAPDIVGSAFFTWLRSEPMLPRIRALGYRVALAAQNGWHPDPIAWDAFDAVLLGGDDAFKLGNEGRQAAVDALAHGKWLHMGRVNSWQRLAYAAGLGCDSADGTTIRFNPGRYVGEVSRWLARVNAPRLPV